MPPGRAGGRRRRRGRGHGRQKHEEQQQASDAGRAPPHVPVSVVRLLVRLGWVGDGVDRIITTQVSMMGGCVIMFRGLRHPGGRLLALT